MGHKKKIKLGADGSVHIESEHFDVGGTVSGTVNSGLSSGLSNAPAGAIGNGIAQSAGSAPAFGEVQSIANPLGQAAQGIGSAFTAQNQFQATAPNIAAPEANYTSANAGQNALAGALTNEANGQGPNPALAQLNQTTNANANQAAGLVASQRGLNPGEAARLGANAEVNANQQAGGQAATLAAQQQLAAQSGLESVYGQQENAATQNANVVGGQNLTAQGLNQSTAQANANAVNQNTGGLLNGISGALGLAKGGKVENPKLATVSKGDRFKGNLMPSHLKAIADIYHGNKFADGGSVMPGNFGAVAAPPPLLQQDYVAAPKASVPAKPEAKESDDDSDNTSDGTAGGAIGSAIGSLMSKGGDVPGKPKVAHDAYKNDVVDAKLTPGEVVIDLDTLKSKGPIGDAARMLAQHIEDKNGKGNHEDDFKEALSRAVAGRKSK